MRKRRPKFEVFALPGYDYQTPIRKAIKLKGSAVKLAKEIGITSQAVGRWQWVPAERVIAVENATGGRVTRYELRPDLYPFPEY